MSQTAVKIQAPRQKVNFLFTVLHVLQIHWTISKSHKKTPYFDDSSDQIKLKTTIHLTLYDSIALYCSEEETNFTAASSSEIFFDDPLSTFQSADHQSENEEQKVFLSLDKTTKNKNVHFRICFVPGFLNSHFQF